MRSEECRVTAEASASAVDVGWRKVRSESRFRRHGVERQGRDVGLMSVESDERRMVVVETG